MFSLNLIWQFFCHTRFVGKLGPLEWIFNTPSHHRVHHGRNPKYLDKNYAGTLIIWDRMFGTFQKEEEEPVYGITKPLHSWNPVWANFHVWYDLGKDAWDAPFWWDKIRIWFMPLGWTPRGLQPKPDPPEVSADTVVKYDMRPPQMLFWYGFAHFGIATLIGLFFIFQESEQTPIIEQWDLIVVLLFTLLTVGGIFELRPWTPTLELVRLLLFPFWIWHRSEGSSISPILLIGLSVLVSVVSALVLLGYRGSFTHSTTMEDDPRLTPGGSGAG